MIVICIIVISEDEQNIAKLIVYVQQMKYYTDRPRYLMISNWSRLDWVYYPVISTFVSY